MYASRIPQANRGPGTNSSQFFITTVVCPHLDGKHVVFGKLIEGEDIIRQLEDVDTLRDKPVFPCKIKHCNELKCVLVTHSGSPIPCV
jgi:cyclophilin family peptidyl-prolyl cis-trans isomerase